TSRRWESTAKPAGAETPCFADRGWKIMLTQYGPPPPRPRVAVTHQPSWSPWSSSGSSDTSARDDEIRRNDAINQQNQINSDVMNQSIQSVNDQQAPDARQQQGDQNLGNQPTFGQ